MAEIKVDLINYCNVNSSPNSCNSSKVNNQSNEQNSPNNQDSKPSTLTHQQNEFKNNSNNSNQSNNISDHTDSTNNQCIASTSKFHVNENSKTQNKQSPTKIDLEEQDENVDQFDDDFDHFGRKNSFNDSSNTKSSDLNSITPEDIGLVLQAFQDRSLKVSDYDAKEEKIQSICLNLFSYDYDQDDLIIINNTKGEFCSTYPPKIIIPKIKSFSVEQERLRNLILKARFGRSRCRFAVPVMMFNNKYICRSATLSHCLEVYSRQSLANFFRPDEAKQIEEIATEISQLDLDTVDAQPDKPELNYEKTASSESKGKISSYLSLIKQEYSDTVNEARVQDILLLNYLNVKNIFDLMVEMKKVKYGLYVASSEKTDKFRRYRDFNLNVTPYPGCEYFKFYRDNNYQAEGMVYDWDGHSFIDAHLNLPKTRAVNSLNIDFNDYKKWDLNNLTLNYMKLILAYLVEPSNESILLHCISGWDRTSEFVSLIRLSLWADYELHPNLNFEEILYLTLAYDWFLFGHDLTDRVSKGEEIMHFCFYFLKFLSSTEYSIDYLRKNIVKKGDEYVRVRFNCCGICKHEEDQSKHDKSADDGTKVSPLDLDDEVSSSMYSSQASTVVNNNLKKERFMNQFNEDSDECSGSDAEDDMDKNSNLDSSNDAIDQTNLITNCTRSTKPFVVDPNFDQHISASPSLFSTFNEIRNNGMSNLNRNSLTIERDASDPNKFDIISLDDQSLSSNSSYDVLHAANKQQTNNQQSSTPTNQQQFNLAVQSGCTSSSSHPQQSSPSNNLNILHANKHNINTNSDILRKDSFSCGSPPQLLNTNCCEIADEETQREDEETQSSSGESITLAEDTVDSSGSRKQNSNIQRSNAVAIPSRKNRQSTNAYNSSNNSNLSNMSNKLSDQSFNLNRCDSWQIVTGTGSVKDKNHMSSNSLDEIRRNMNSKIAGAASSTNHFSSKGQNDNTFYYVPTCCCNNLNCGKHCEKVDKVIKEKGLENHVYTRKRRLNDVRVIFYQCYSKYIGLSTANGSIEMSTRFSHLIERIKYPFRGNYYNHTLSTASTVIENTFNRNSSTRLSNRKPTTSFQSYIEDRDLNSRDKNGST